MLKALWVEAGQIYINIGVTVRFGFDSVRTSQLHTDCQETKQRERPLRCIIYVLKSVAALLCHTDFEPIYLHRRGAFSVARFDNPGNAKAFTLWNE